MKKAIPKCGRVERTSTVISMVKASSSAKQSMQRIMT